LLLKRGLERVSRESEDSSTVSEFIVTVTSRRKNSI
jgi:hypothetical protein